MCRLGKEGEQEEGRAEERVFETMWRAGRSEETTGWRVGARWRVSERIFGESDWLS